MESGKPTKTTVTHLTNLADMPVGSILIFKSSEKATLKKNPEQFFIMALQALFSFQSKGYYDSTHAGIYTGIQNGKPMVAHVVGSGYVHEPLEDMLKRQIGGNRSFLAFAPNNPDIGKKIAKTAIIEDEKLKPQWKVKKGIKAVARTSRRDPNREIKARDRMRLEVICSEFVIRVMKQATQLADKDQNNEDAKKLSDWRKFYPDIDEASLPKDLEAELRRHDNFQLFSYIKEDQPYDMIRNAICKQLDRLGEKAKKSKSAEKAIKFASAQKKFKELTGQLENSNLSELHKAMYLFREMTPVLLINTGFGFKTPSSYKEISTLARQISSLFSDKGIAADQDEKDMFDFLKVVFHPETPKDSKEQKPDDSHLTVHHDPDEIKELPKEENAEDTITVSVHSDDDEKDESPTPFRQSMS